MVGRRSGQKEAYVSSSVIFLLVLKDHMEHGPPSRTRARAGAHAHIVLQLSLSPLLSLSLLFSVQLLLYICLESFRPSISAPWCRFMGACAYCDIKALFKSPSGRPGSVFHTDMLRALGRTMSFLLLHIREMNESEEKAK